MGKTISTDIQINAPVEKVWAVLTDFAAYPSWNPFIRSLNGEVAVGNTITVRIEPPGGSAMTFKPVVLNYEPGKLLRWKGKLLLPGLFDGTHVFELTDNGDGTTNLVHEEHFSGILVPLFSKMLDNNTMEGFRQMNLQLKLRAEKG